MDVDWSVEAALDDPTVVVPWSSEPSLGYVDLNLNPEAIHEIAEAQAWPEVHYALMTLNAAGSEVWTAKCDAWALDEAARELDFGPVAFGFGMYVDVLPHRPDIFASLSDQRRLVEAWVTTLRNLPSDDARVDFVIRPASWNEEPGFAITVYVFSYGAEETTARANWFGMSAIVTDLISGKATDRSRRYNEPAGE